MDEKTYKRNSYSISISKPIGELLERMAQDSKENLSAVITRMVCKGLGKDPEEYLKGMRKHPNRQYATKSEAFSASDKPFPQDMQDLRKDPYRIESVYEILLMPDYKFWPKGEEITLLERQEIEYMRTQYAVPNGL